MRGLNIGHGADLIAAYVANPTPDHRNRLAEHFTLCIQLAARHVFYRNLSPTQRRAISLEEVEQIAHLAFHCSIHRFNPDRGVPLTAFLQMALPRAIIDELRRLRISTQRRSKASVVSLGSEVVADTSPSALREFEVRHFRKTVLRSLPPRLRLYAAHRYLRGQSTCYAARKSGIGRDKAFELQREIARLVQQDWAAGDRVVRTRCDV